VALAREWTEVHGAEAEPADPDPAAAETDVLHADVSSTPRGASEHPIARNRAARARQVGCPARSPSRSASSGTRRRSWRPRALHGSTRAAWKRRKESAGQPMRAAALRSYRELLQAAWVREVPVGPVDETLARVGRILRDAKIPFAVAGGFAVSEHGYERFTRGAGARGTETSAAT